jgi:hypothetical protein
MVKAEKMYQFPADQLQLFLAKRGSEWLTEADVAKRAGATDGLTQLVSARAEVGDIGLSKEDVRFQVTKEHATAKTTPVHVMVVTRGGSASETSKLDRLCEKVDKLNDKLDKTVLGKRKVRHSSASSSLLNDLYVRVRASRAVPFETENRVEPFTWGYLVDERGLKVELTQEQQRKRYREYFEGNISDTLAKNKLCVYGVEKGEDGEDILSADVPGHNVELVGRTDMIILSDQVLENPLELDMLPDVRLIIEVKQKVERRSIFQAVSELVALDIMAAEPVMALLTDLQKHWQFFWVADPTNNRATIDSVTIRDPSKAFAVIKTLLSSAGAGAVVSLPCFEEPTKRQKISGVLASMAEGGGTGIRESIERYYDIASVLGPDIEMARAVARQVTRAIPTLRNFS